jgi:hypothetical protein
MPREGDTTIPDYSDILTGYACLLARHKVVVEAGDLAKVVAFFNVLIDATENTIRAGMENLKHVTLTASVHSSHGATTSRKGQGVRK